MNDIRAARSALDDSGRERIVRTARGSGLRALSGLLVLVLLAGAACGKDKTDAQLANEALAAGLKAHAEGRLNEAEAAYRQVLVYAPQNKYAYYNLGLIDQTRGDSASAESGYRTAISIDPEFVPPMFNLAILRTAAGDETEAIDLYQRVIEVDFGYAAAHLNLGFLLIENGHRKEGTQELETAVELDPSLASRIPEQLPEDESEPTESEGPAPSGSATPSP